MSNNALKEFCSTVLVDIEKDGEILKDQEYFLLSDVLPEDRQLREGLQQQRLVSRLSCLYIVLIFKHLTSKILPEAHSELFGLAIKG